MLQENYKELESLDLNGFSVGSSKRCRSVFSDSDPTYPGTLMIRKAPDRTARATRQHARKFLRNQVDEEGIVLVSSLPLKII